VIFQQLTCKYNIACHIAHTHDKTETIRSNELYWVHLSTSIKHSVTTLSISPGQRGTIVSWHPRPYALLKDWLLKIWDLPSCQCGSLCIWKVGKISTFTREIPTFSKTEFRGASPLVHRAFRIGTNHWNLLKYIRLKHNYLLVNYHISDRHCTVETKNIYHHIHSLSLIWKQKMGWLFLYRVHTLWIIWLNMTLQAYIGHSKLPPWIHRIFQTKLLNQKLTQTILKMDFFFKKNIIKNNIHPNV